MDLTEYRTVAQFQLWVWDEFQTKARSILWMPCEWVHCVRMSVVLDDVLAIVRPRLRSRRYINGVLQRRYMRWQGPEEDELHTRIITRTGVRMIVKEYGESRFPVRCDLGLVVGLLLGITHSPEALALKRRMHSCLRPCRLQ